MSTETNETINLKELIDFIKIYKETYPLFGILFAGITDDPELLKNHTFSRDQLKKYREMHLEKIRKININSLPRSEQVKLISFIGWVTTEADAFGINPQLDRPSNVIYSEYLQVSTTIENIHEKLEENNDPNIDEKIIILIKELLGNREQYLDGLFDVFLKGKKGITWLNPQEKEKTISTLEKLSAADTVNKIRDFWKNAGGNPAEIEKFLLKFNNANNAFKSKAEAVNIQGEIRAGNERYMAEFSEAKIGITPQELYEWTNKSIMETKALMQEILTEHIDKNLTLEEFFQTKPENHSFSLDYYINLSKTIYASLLNNGLLPNIDMDNILFSETEENRRTSCPTAATDLGYGRARINFTSPQSTEDEIEMFHGRKILVAHELTHAISAIMAKEIQLDSQLTYSPNVHRDIAIEAIAFFVEQNSLQFIDDLTPIDILMMLQHYAYRLSRVITELDWHINGKDAEEIIENHKTNSFISRETASIDASRAFGNPFSVLVYVLGMSGMYNLKELYPEMQITQFTNYIFEQGGAGFLPPHLVAYQDGKISTPKEFNWLNHDKNYPVLLARKLLQNPR